MTALEFHDVRAEEAALAAAMTNEAACAHVTARLCVDDFQRNEGRAVFRAIAELHAAGRPVDAVTVVSAVRAATKDDDAAQARSDFVGYLSDSLALAAHVGEYTAVVLRMSARRRAVRAAQAINEAAASANGDAAELPGMLETLAAEAAAEIRKRGADAPADASPVRLAFVTAPELAAVEDESFDWVLDDYIATSSTVQLSGAPKLAGKTTWSLCLAAAVASGRKFMGRATRKGVVVYLSEQTRRTFKVSARGTGVLDNPDVHVLLRSRVWAEDWDTIIRDATAYCLEVGAVLLVVDTLGRWASLMGDAENDAGAALEVMQPLEEAAAAGLAVLVVRHDRKDPGANIVDAGRGSGAYAGAFDQLLALKRVGGAGHDNRRKLVCEGRFEETPRELVIEYQGGDYLDRGTEANIESAEVRATVLAVLRDADEARTFDHLLEACGGAAKETTLQRVLGSEGNTDKGRAPSGLVGEGLVRRAKGAGAASPRAFGYWLPVNDMNTPPSQLPIPVDRGELISPRVATEEAGLLPSARPKAQTGEQTGQSSPTPHGVTPIGGEFVGGAR